MRSFFTSSLDKIDPPTPFVNAMNWDAYRSQFRTSQSSKSGNRNCVLASGSLNPESANLSEPGSRIQDIPLIVQNTAAHRFSIEMAPELESLSASQVDACFSEGDMDFLSEKPALQIGSSWLTGPGLITEETYELELGLLESVQDIAIALTRTTPKRVVRKQESTS